MSWFSKTLRVSFWIKTGEECLGMATFGTVYIEVIVPDGGQAGSRWEAMKNRGWPVFWDGATNSESLCVGS